MPYSTTISALDLSGGVPDVRITVGYTWTEVGGPTSVEQRQDGVTLDLSPNQFLSQTPTTFSYAGSFAPPPRPSWFIALWIQEIPRIPNDSGWLFRSGRFETEPPALPIEVILAPEQLIGNAELLTAIGPLPMTSNSTTITSLTLTIAGADIAITAVGTDTNLPSGVTFTYTATLRLLENGSLRDIDDPLDILLMNPSLSFTAGAGTGFVTFLLNLVSGIIQNEVAPRIKNTIKNRLNAGIISEVATRLNRVPSTELPAGVVLSIRSVRATTRTAPAGPESVIGVRAALGAFGGVLNKFPPLTGGGGSGKCFIATAALSPHAPEVMILKKWRDHWLRDKWLGPSVIGAYERLSPPFANLILRSKLLRAFMRVMIVIPAARIAGFLLKRSRQST